MMRRAFLTLLALGLAGQAAADTVVAARTIRSQSLLGPDDLALVGGDTPGALSSLDDALGMEARVNLYAGRPIRAGEIGPPAIVERNQIVRLVYAQGGLNIQAEGRSLGRAGVGDSVRVMNLASRQTVSGRVAEDGSIRVAPGIQQFARR